MTDIVERLRGNAIGNPARIPWPHRLLHDAADYIEAQRGALKARNDSIVKQAEQIDKLRAALEWQPIETAPKNGKDILVAAPGFTPELAWWDAEDVWLKGWHCGGGRSDTYGPSFEPTHWMPLPAPPARAALGGEK
jgi:hypothetical protein